VRLVDLRTDVSFSGPTSSDMYCHWDPGFTMVNLDLNCLRTTDLSMPIEHDVRGCRMDLLRTLLGKRPKIVI
jgi:hypothetical protein